MAEETIADRLRRWRSAKFMTPTQLAERLNIPLPTLYGHENGSRYPERENLEKYATFYRTTVDAVMYGDASDGNVTQAPVVGYVGLGGAIQLTDPTQRQTLEVVDAPPGVTVQCSAARIRGDYLYPFREHWVVFWAADRPAGVPADCIGQLCVVQLMDGRLLLKELYRGTQDGLYRLGWHNSPPIEDVAVEWAARVVGMTMP